MTEFMQLVREMRKAQKKYIGNAVEVNMAKALCVALYGELNRI